ncbi:dihydroorotate dehydrogenase electron transfer subunit [Paenibacillus agaridevorans]|nr:dihydroorotate dehydrogenase electron transfer subunit [Paenibacillus agaridevorans]
MATVLSNERLTASVFRLAIEGSFHGEPGQFYMLRSWDKSPLLSRPISIHDLTSTAITFLIRLHGEGTRLLSRLTSGDQVTLYGPYGNGFPKPGGNVALVGGGMGIAPLLFSAKRFPFSKVFLGFSGEPFAVASYQALHGDVVFQSGGTILDAIDLNSFDKIYACGPLPMMAELRRRTAETAAQLYVSIEKRMACGIGICNGCTINVGTGNHKACTVGPVFPAEEVDFDELLEL